MASLKERKFDEKRYLREGGTKCPYCSSSDIEELDFDFCGDVATQDMECMECEKSWTATYELTGAAEAN